jgi:hypothetical protein
MLNSRRLIMAGINVGEGQEQSWSFEPVALDPIRLEAAPLAKISPITRAVGNLATRFGSTEEGFIPKDENGYGDRSILLHTPNGPVHYYRVANEYHDNGTLAVEYPKSIGELPSELIASTLGVEPDELHIDPHARTVEPRQVASWRFPEVDDKGSHTWLLDREGTVVHYGGPHLRDTAVVDGVLGEVHVPEMRSLALNNLYYGQFVEEEPHKIDVATVQSLEDRFKRFALAVADYMGVTNQLSAKTHENSPGLLSYHAMGTDLNQSAAFVIPKLAVRGYDVMEYERTPGENVDPGYKVLIASKDTPKGTETLAVYEGLSAFWYTRGSRQWQITRGLVLRDKVSVEEFDRVLKPVGKLRSQVLESVKLKKL